MSVAPGSLLSRILLPVGLAALAWSMLSGSLPAILATIAILACAGVFLFQSRVSGHQRLPCMELLERVPLGGGALQAVRVGSRVHLLVVSGREVRPLDVMPAMEFVAGCAEVQRGAGKPAMVPPPSSSPDLAWRRTPGMEEALRGRHCVTMRSPFVPGADAVGGAS